MPLADDAANGASFDENMLVGEGANTNKCFSVDVVRDVDNNDNVGGAARIRQYPRWQVGVVEDDDFAEVGVSDASLKNEVVPDTNFMNEANRPTPCMKAMFQVDDATRVEY